MTARTETRMALSASQEDYLEAIYHLVRDRREARTSTIADRLRVRRSSVTGALRTLAARGLVEHAAYGSTTLTRRGMAAARAVADRHHILREFIETILGLPAEQAEQTACAMEHAAPPALPARLRRLIFLLRRQPDVLRQVREAGA